ncbi:hypothetical protein BSZ39_03770 [Bowdeniella nasicola]|uniref:Uncharacterized protein n=1 Tax=Bowdeniella nasicola TaxID=208480 RepID=A0A1Q5Q461_9ACTO|nr:hypothetical protein [Bowdeniella nasicola]OKL54499.1 hypothetical protein BSZ39_03770 [Bowdeniella nasicola]
MSCEHCDSSIPHDHSAVPKAIAGAKARAMQLAVVQVAIASVVVIASLLLLPISAWPVPFGWGLGTWAAATGLGAMVGTWARGGRELSQTSVAMRVRLASGITGAIVLVLGARDAAGRSSDGRFVGGTATAGMAAWQVALAVVAGWLIGAAIMSGIQTFAWLRIIETPGDAGELVRAGVIHSGSHGFVRPLIAFVVPALALAVWTLGLAWLPWLVLVALPAQALIAIAMIRR